MTPDRERWPRVKAIFHAALDQAPEQRAAFLSDACGGDVALRDEVESLVAAHAGAGSFVEHPAIDALSPAGIATEDAPPLGDGDTFGPYRVLAPLDAGGMGEVYRAFDTRLHREVAVKVLPAAWSASPDRVARLEREARLLAALNHAHIATIHGLETSAGRHAIVMELIEGPTLAQRLSRGALPLDDALAIARQVAEALEAAHAKGIVHRDLKPANIKLTADGAAKVLDFGLATASPSERPDPSSVSSAGPGESDGAVAGTPGYMSPEQWRGDRVDGRTDIWAFGCVLYEMLAGRRAFGGDGEAGPAEDDSPDWDRLPPHVPARVRRLLRRSLERDPRRRLHHIADARIEIDDREGDDALARTGRGSRRGTRGAVAAAALLVTAGAAAGLLARRGTAPAPRVVEITTPRTADQSSFALAPDGRSVAFVAEREGRSMLWVRPLDTAAARALPGTEGARRPFWSPDSRSIGFFVTSELKRVEARGGAPRTVTPLLAGTTAAWGPDGTILFSSTPTPSLHRVHADGGAPRAVTSPGPGSTGHRHPQFLPGGREFLLFSGGADDVRGVYLGEIGSSRTRRLTLSDTQGAYVEPGWLLFVRRGTLFAQGFDLERHALEGDPIVMAESVAFDPIDGVGAFSASDAGVVAYRAARPAATRVSWFDRSGRPLGIMGPSDLTGLTNLRLSPNGRHVAAERSLGNETDLWVLEGRGQTRLTHAPSGSLRRLPLWSPDGARVAFQSVGSGSVALAVKSWTHDGAEEALLASPSVKVPCDWSPDGRYLMYYVPDPKTGTDLWLLPLDTRVPELFLQTDANELWGQFSPDGRWVAYQSNETGRYEVYVRSFGAAGGAIPISSEGGVYPRWSRDGTEIFFIAPDAALVAVAIRRAGNSLEPGAPTVLFPTRRLGGGANVIARGHQYDVTTDGRFLVNVDTETGPPPLTLLLDWRPQGNPSE